MNEQTELLKQKILHLEQMHQAGLVSAELHRESRQRLERELVDLVLNAPLEMGQRTAAATEQATPGSSRPQRRLLGGIAAFTLLVGGAGYLWAGSPTSIGAPAGSAWPTLGSAMPGSATPSAATPGSETPAAPHALGNEQMVGMVEALAEKLKSKPDDAEGWAMLARSYATLGRHAESVPAYAKALALSPRDAPLMADYADALALQQERRLSGKPQEWIDKALALDSAQPKARLLAGTAAFDRKDYVTAIRHWEQAASSAPPDSALAQQARAGLDEARQLAGLKPTDGTAAPDKGARIAGTVSLAPALAAKARPDDTVFIFARPAQGARMPLAMLKRQVKDLPFRFELDDSLAMSPQARLSSASEVVVTARISRSGQAQPQPGDLEGASAAVVLGRSDLQLNIDRVLP